jgi:hypothetical protein
VHLDEDKHFVQLRENGNGDGTHWILDLGATNHMTSMQKVFSEIDLRVHNTVHFEDGSIANIEGQNTILIKCKSGGHKALTGVYYISCLMANIVSLRQLEEAGYKIVVHSGFLKLWIMPRSWLPRSSVRQITCICSTSTWTCQCVLWRKVQAWHGPSMGGMATITFASSSAWRRVTW